MSGRTVRIAFGLLLVTLAIGVADAQTTAPATAPRAPSTAVFWPDLGWSTLCWFAAVVVLALTIRLRPVVWIRNVDGLVLAGMCILLALGRLPGGPGWRDLSWQWWAYVGLTLAALYWLIRGLALVVHRDPVRHPGTVSGGVRLVLVLAALAVCVYTLATAPISAGSRDGVAGGYLMADTGRLPYGDVPGHDSRSPLLYLVHAGAARLVAWDLDPTREQAVAWLVNGFLFLLVVTGLLVIGRRMQQDGAEWVLVALVAVFPGILAALPRPEVLLPVALLTWTLAFALLPGLGGLLATFTAVLAGVAWPLAWLALPVVLAWLWRRSGAQVFGSLVGLAGGVALLAFGLIHLVQPTLPRAAGALRMAGLVPNYTAQLDDQGTVVLLERKSDELPPTAPLTAQLWQYLVQSEHAALHQVEGGAGGLNINWPNNVNSRAVLFRVVDADATARPVLQANYRELLAGEPPDRRLQVGLRTVLESTWLAERPREPAEWPSAWSLWARTDDTLPALWVWARRAAKALAGILALWAALAILLGGRIQPRHITAGMLLAVTAAVLAGETGAVASVALLVPFAAALWAVQERGPQDDVKTVTGTRARELPMRAPHTAGPVAVVTPVAPRPQPPVRTTPSSVLPPRGTTLPERSVAVPPASPGERAPAPRITLDPIPIAPPPEPENTGDGPERPPV